MPSSRGSSPPRDRTCVSYVSFTDRWVLYPLAHLGSPLVLHPPLNELMTLDKSSQLAMNIGNNNINIISAFLTGH